MHRQNFVSALAVLIAGAVQVGAQQSATAPPAPRPSVGAAAKPIPKARPQMLPGTRGSLFSTIRGNALNAVNQPLPGTAVRLRDARRGHVVDSQTTDNAGVFTFTTIDPGSYIVEVMAADQTVVAASQIIDVNAGDAVTAVVKLPFHTPPLAGVLGNSVSSAIVVTSEAIASGVLATTVAGAPVSQQTF